VKVHLFEQQDAGREHQVISIGTEKKEESKRHVDGAEEQAGDHTD
jgi:hypothetical protein